jgi:hypothetical protein
MTQTLKDEIMYYNRGCKNVRARLNIAMQLGSEHE